MLKKTKNQKWIRKRCNISQTSISFWKCCKKRKTMSSGKMIYRSWNTYCRNVRGTIIESEGKVDDIDCSVFFQSAAVFWIYISSNIGVRTLYLSNFPSIQIAYCCLWLSSACSVLRHSMKIAILVQVRAEANDLATPRHTIDWCGAVSFIGVA